MASINQPTVIVDIIYSAGDKRLFVRSAAYRFQRPIIFPVYAASFSPWWYWVHCEGAEVRDCGVVIHSLPEFLKVGCGYFPDSEGVECE